MPKMVRSCAPCGWGRLRSLLVVAGLVGLGLPARAEPAAEVRPRAVVELFTSQGCSSCPPADRLLIDLASRPDVIALAMHVNYWDRLGWRDTLGSRAFALRQRAYAARRGDGEVYTPQAVVNGLVHRLGSDPDAIVEATSTTRHRRPRRDPGRGAEAVADGNGGHGHEQAFFSPQRNGDAVRRRAQAHGQALLHERDRDAVRARGGLVRLPDLIQRRTS